MTRTSCPAAIVQCESLKLVLTEKGRTVNALKTGTVELLIWSAAAYQSEYKALEVMAPEELPAIVGATIAERPKSSRVR